MTHFFRLVFVLVLVCFPTTTSAVIRYVDNSAPAGGTGVSWATAYNNLQTALGVAVNGDEIRVGQGTYKPGQIGSARTVTFTLPNGVRLRGSFRGFGSPTPDTQNITLYPTTLSGDLAGNDTAPGTYTNSGENCYHVVTINGSVSSNTQLEALIIERGFANSSDSLSGLSRGGGVWCNGPSVLSVNNCTLRYNLAWVIGGGLYIDGGTFTCQNSRFDTNRASDTGQPFGGFGNGGGVYCRNTASTISGCTFVNCQCGIATAGGGGISGAGIISNCYFEDCLSSAISGQNTQVVDSDFIGNSSEDGGAFIGSGSLTNCSFINNSASTYGGAVFNNSGSLTIDGCTFDGNDANNGCAIAVRNATTTAANCGFTNNGNSPVTTVEVFLTQNAAASLTLQNCTIDSNEGLEFVLRSFGTTNLVDCSFTNNTVGSSVIENRGTMTMRDCSSAGNIIDNGQSIYSILNRSQLNLIGTVSAGISNRQGGTVAPAGLGGDQTGLATIGVGFDQSQSGGNTEVQIGGPIAGDSHDAIHIQGPANLGGGLIVQLVDGFDPPVGSCYEVISASGSITGLGAVYTPPMLGKFFTVNAEGGCSSLGPGGISLTVQSINDFLDFSAGVFPISGDATAVEVADFDGLNGDDVAVALTNGTGSPGTLLILLNDGTGLNFTVATYPVGNDPSALAVGRFDGNGSLDVAVCNRGSAGGGTVSVLENDGAGSFSPLATTSSLGTNLSAIAAGNFDGTPLEPLGPGGDDLAVCIVTSNSNAAGQIRILTNNGSGVFLSGALLATGRNPSAIDPADVDNDRDLDLVTVHSNEFPAIGFLPAYYTAGVFLNSAGAGSFDPRVDLVVGTQPVAVTVGDLNDDGLPDIVTANKSAIGSISILMNDPGKPGQFLGAATLAVGANARAVECLRFDNDNDLDIAVLADDAGQPSVQLLRNDKALGVIGGTVPFTLVESRPVGDNASDIASGNLDNQGAEDVATIDEGGTPLAGRNDGPAIAPGTGALSLFFNSSEVPGNIRTIYSTIATSPTSLVPPGGALTSITPGTRFSSFDRPYRSADGTQWAMVADTDASTVVDAIILAGSGLSGSPRVQEGRPVPFSNPVELFGPFDRNLGIRDDGGVAFSTNTNGPTATDEYVLSVDPGGNTGLWWQEGLAIPGIPIEPFGPLIDSVHVIESGLVSVRAPGTPGPLPDTQDDFLIRGFNIVAQSGVTIPTGQAGGGTFPWEIFDANAFYGAFAGSTWIAKGDLATGLITTSDDVVVVNNQVRLQEGSIIPGSGFASPIALNLTGDIAMTPNGDWFARGSNADGIDWIVRNGTVIAHTDAAVTPGSTEVYDDSIYSPTFFAMTGNNLGDWLVGGVTNAFDPSRNEVVVFNGVKVILREGDRVDLNGNGLPDDNVFLNDPEIDDLFLTEDRFVYFQSTLRDALGTALGTAFLRIKIDPAPGCQANIGGGDGVVNVQDLLAVIGAWGACADPNHCPADIAPPGGDNTVNVQDLLAVIGAWGACP